MLRRDHPRKQQKNLTQRRKGAKVRKISIPA